MQRETSSLALLAQQVDEAVTPLIEQQPLDLRDRLPRHACGVLLALRDSRAQDRWSQPEVLNALHAVNRLGALLNWLELRVLTRGRHWHGWVRQAELGESLGISASGVTRRRQRLAAAVAGTATVKISPSTPRISPQHAERLAQEVLDRRTDEQDEVDRLPDVRDLVGTVRYVLQHEGAVRAETFAKDLVDCLRIVVCLRRLLARLEADYIAIGRRSGIPALVLGEPFGRRDPRATWRARQRILHGEVPGGRRVVTRTFVESDLAVDTEVDPQVHQDIRAMAGRLLDFHEDLAADADLDEWLRWLSEQDLHEAGRPLTRRQLGLLWATLDEVAAVIDPDDQEHGEVLGLADERLAELRMLVCDALALLRRQRTRHAAAAAGNRES